MRARRNVGILCYSRQKRGDGESKEIKKRDRKESSDMYIQVDIFVSSVAGSASGVVCLPSCRVLFRSFSFIYLFIFLLSSRLGTHRAPSTPAREYISVCIVTFLRHGWSRQPTLVFWARFLPTHTHTVVFIYLFIFIKKSKWIKFEYKLPTSSVSLLLSIINFDLFFLFPIVRCLVICRLFGLLFDDALHVHSNRFFFSFPRKYSICSKKMNKMEQQVHILLPYGGYNKILNTLVSSELKIFRL